MSQAFKIFIKGYVSDMLDEKMHITQLIKNTNNLNCGLQYTTKYCQTVNVIVVK